jgi:hypothetical protein
VVLKAVGSSENKEERKHTPKMRTMEPNAGSSSLHQSTRFPDTPYLSSRGKSYGHLPHPGSRAAPCPVLAKKFLSLMLVPTWPNSTPTRPT